MYISRWKRRQRILIRKYRVARPRSTVLVVSPEILKVLPCLPGRLSTTLRPLLGLHNKSNSSLLCCTFMTALPLQTPGSPEIRCRVDRIDFRGPRTIDHWTISRRVSSHNLNPCQGNALQKSLQYPQRSGYLVRVAWRNFMFTTASLSKNCVRL